MEYDELTDRLGASGLPIDAAEAHGLVCGLLCAIGATDLDAGVLHDAFSQYELEPSVELDIGERLADLYRDSRQRLEQGMSDFPLLLPDDTDLDQMTSGLAGWCRGFLYGLVEGGISDLDRLPGDAGEIVRDMLDISEAVPALDEENEVQEKALAELEEYVRVGVQLLYEELQPENDPSNPDLLH